jgi:peptidyl-prolyl cis-trans isomerase B (cyclophilin B)
MYKYFLMLVAAFNLFGCQQANATTKGENMAKQTVVIRTNLGDIEIALDTAKAPETVANFLNYVDAKHYNGTVFHRVIDGFMIQGGGYNSDFSEKKTNAPIRNEADNRLENKRGTIAMARTSDVHSASAQFFINVSDNDFLNFRNPTPSGYGYCVFGEVTKGMNVVDEIRKVKTGGMKGHQDVPLQPVTIVEVVRKS